MRAAAQMVVRRSHVRMMEEVAYLLWWIGCTVLAVVLSYPLFSIVGSRKRNAFKITGQEVLSPVSVILVAYNEATHARARISGLLSDPDLLSGSEIIVVTGGATDRTVEELSNFSGDPRVRLVIKEHRIPKILGLNEAVGLARHEILVYCDWRQAINPGSLGRLVRQVQVPGVGVATAKLVDDAGGVRGSWTRELIAAMNQWNSLDGGCMNVHGACYAQRRSCFVPIPSDIIFDDLYVVASMHAQHKSVVQVEDAIIHDVRFDQYYGRERVLRLTRGLLLQLVNHGGLILRMAPRRAWRFLLVKYGKLLIPFALVLLLPQALSFLLQEEHPFRWVYCSPILLLLVPRLRCWLATMMRFCLFTLVGVLRFYLLADRSNRWEKLKLYDHHVRS